MLHIKSTKFLYDLESVFLDSYRLQNQTPYRYQ